MDKFSMFSKWFWVGMAVSVVSGPAGIIFGCALLTEPEHRKEGVVITVWAIVCSAAIVMWVLSFGK